MTKEKIIEFAIDLVTSIGLKIVFAAIILFVGCKLIKFIKKWMKTSKKLEKVDM